MGGLGNRGVKRPDLSEWNKQHLGDKHPKWKSKPEPKLCECSCGDYAKPDKRFIVGHNYKLQKGKSAFGFGKFRPDRSEMNRQQMGDKHPRFGVRDYKLSARLMGENNPNWNGGSSFLPYGPGFNKELKEHIREKFNHTCILCDSWADIPHHIDYDKNNNVEENFVLLCVGDNSKVNFNREFWEAQFKTLNGIYDPKFLGL